jgi:hypothetical protein
MNMLWFLAMGIVRSLWSLGSVAGLQVELLVGSFCLVDGSPLQPFLSCLFIVSLLVGKFLATAFMVRPGHDAYCLFFIAATHVGLVGNLATACRYQMSSGCVFNL